MHILANAGYLIQELISSSPELSAETEWYEDLFCQRREEEDYEDELREPLEFWIISDQLAAFLQERGELLTHYFEFWIWGREATGQAIEMDYVIEEFLASEHNRESLF